MDKLFFGLIMLVFFTSCQRIEKIKDNFSKDMNRTDSVVNMAVDSISAQVVSDTADKGYIEESTVKTIASEKKKEEEDLQNAYSILLEAIQKKDKYLLHQLCYYNDSIFFIRVQGIFQVLEYEPIENLYYDLYGDVNDSLWYCKLNFNYFPDLHDLEHLPTGCFARKLKDFHKFSAIIELEEEANLAIDPTVVRKAKQIESRVKYEVLNTYMVWSFYFIKENGKFYLVAIDYNQY